MFFVEKGADALLHLTVQPLGDGFTAAQCFPNGCGADGVQRRVDESRARRQRGGVDGRVGARVDDEGITLYDFLPMLPPIEAGPVVASYYEVETSVGVQSGECRKGLKGVRGAWQVVLEVADMDVRVVAGGYPGQLKAQVVGPEVVGKFKWVVRRDYEP